MNEADILELPRPSGKGPAHLCFDLFSFHHYFQIVLATTIKYQDTKQGFGTHERLTLFTLLKGHFLMEDLLIFPIRSNPITYSYNVKQLLLQGTHHSYKFNTVCVTIKWLPP